MSLLGQHDNVDIETYLKFILLTMTWKLMGDEIRFLRKFKIIPEECIFCEKPVPFKRNLTCHVCNDSKEMEKVKELIEEYLKKNY